MNGVNKLISDVNKKLRNWNERSNFTLKGVRNLSPADLDTLVLYAENYDGYGGFNGLMKPVGDIAEVLKAYGLM